MSWRDLSARGAKLIKRVVTRSDSSFKFAFLFLRPEQAQAMADVYQFCRIVDDIVDERAPGELGREHASQGLETWRGYVAALYGQSGGEAQALPWADAPLRERELCERLAKAIELFSMPRAPFDEIIAGCAMDLELSFYRDAKELELYCYRVASCVGLLCIAIFGDQGEGACRYANHLGLALQYTNILRDVAEDALRGRIYLPQDLLARHQIRAEDILASRYDARFQAMAAEFSEMAEAEYRAAWREYAELSSRPQLLPAEVMGRTYYEVLQELRKVRFDVFTHRPSLRRRDKLRVLASSLLHARAPLLARDPVPVEAGLDDVLHRGVHGAAP